MKRLFIIFVLPALILFFNFALPGDAFAFTAVDFTNFIWYTDRGDSYNYVVGFQFRANEDITVRQLGFYDSQKNGLTNNHEVGIYDDSGSLLVSGIVSPSDPLDGWFRYSAISPYTLSSGQSYVIAAVLGGESYTDDDYLPSNITFNPALTYIQNRYTWGSTGSLLYPSRCTGVEKGHFGPNFKTDAAPVVPEPASLSLLGLGLLGLALRRKKTSGQNGVQNGVRIIF